MHYINDRDGTIYMRGVFSRQREAFLNNPQPNSTAASRIEKLRIFKDVILSSQDDICSSISKDFGYRSADETMLSDVLATLGSIKYCCKNLKRWMRPGRRRAGMLLSPARVRVEYQPLGVVGIIVPWNFPLALAAGPLAYALAAGNRVMLKMPPRTPAFNRVFAAIIAEVFDEDEVAVVQGGLELSRAFSSLPFDHLLFTGSTSVGRSVMRAAAENLTPVTLELGGKSPAIIDARIPMNEAVKNMIWGKCMNAGQICMAPDYMLVPRQRVDEFVTEYKRAFKRMYGSAESPDMTAVIDEAHMRRIDEFVDDALAKGATVIEAGSAFPPVGKGSQAPTKLLLNVTDDMQVMREEIFGPLLPVIPYDTIDGAIEYVRKRPRPLALYVLSHDKAFTRRILDGTHSGGVGVNDTAMLFVAEDAPFGGVGPSGMGMYHGREGFLTFSNQRTVLERGRFFNTGLLAMPPYGRFWGRLLSYFFIR